MSAIENTYQTFFKSINHLPAGTFVEFSAREKIVDIKRYWDYDFSNSENKLNENDREYFTVFPYLLE